ncbi:MAG: Gfo/Idh/MocA family oxidoreductase [Acidimicrobiia bacterium]|nr:Gfo/Idh/MocA family oxidoreductase [Acidimicrobiia bacterium]
MDDVDEDDRPEAFPIRIGILGAARIAPRAVIQPAAGLAGVEITRVAARETSRAEAFASEHDIAGVADTYEEVVEADDVDVVYNPLPMSLHAEWSIAALRAGKDVLCEKPFASNADEAEEMVRVAEEEGRVLTEAFHYRYHPMFQRILDELASGTIGEVERIEARFDTPVPEPNLRWDYATSGGSLMDLGCYPVSWVRHITGEEPEVVTAVAVEGPDRVDARMTAELAFPSAVTATVASAMDRGPSILLTIIGTAGRIVAANPLSPQNGNRLTIVTERGATSGPVVAGNSYEHMLRAFVDHLVHGSPFPTKGPDAIANMAAIDAIYEAAGLPRRGL